MYWHAHDLSTSLACSVPKQSAQSISLPAISCMNYAVRLVSIYDLHRHMIVLILTSDGGSSLVHSVGLTWDTFTVELVTERSELFCADYFVTLYIQVLLAQ